MRRFERFSLSDMQNSIFSIASNELYLVTDYNKLQYPNYCRWFYGTNIPRVLSRKGEIIFYVDGCSKIAGLVILKKDVELKICTFMVRPEYRRMGLGSKLAEDSFENLGTGFPKITIPETRIDEFEPLITKYGWVESRVIDDYYSPEIVFNDPKDIIIEPQKRLKK